MTNIPQDAISPDHSLISSINDMNFSIFELYLPIILLHFNLIFVPWENRVRVTINPTLFSQRI